MDGHNARKKEILVLVAITGLILATVGLARLSITSEAPSEAAGNNGTPGLAIRGGTEGIADHVVINEVMYNPLGPDPDGEWIELYNPKNATLAISGWYFTNDPSTDGGGTEGSRQFPSFTYIASGDTVIVANSGSQFYANYGFYPDFEVVDTSTAADMIVVAGTLALADTGDDVHIFDSALDADIDTLWFGDGGDIGPAGAAPLVPEGKTSERIPAGEDTDNCADDAVEQTTPTPGISVPELTSMVPSLISVGMILFVCQRRDSNRKNR